MAGNEGWDVLIMLGAAITVLVLIKLAEPRPPGQPVPMGIISGSYPEESG